MAEELIQNANPFDDPEFFRKERFAHYPDIEIKDLLDVDEPHPVYEGQFKDLDGKAFFVFTVGGWLVKRGTLPVQLNWKDAKEVWHGRTIGGDLMIITDTGSPAAAKEMAKDGLLFTLEQVVATAQRMAEVEKARGSGIIIASEVRGRRG